MRYQIIQDIPGRLRLRCGRSLIGQSQAAGIVVGLRECQGVQDARVASANGSVLVRYRPGDAAAREAALAYMDGLEVLALPEAEPGEVNFLDSEDSAFYRDVLGMVLRRMAMRYLAPPQLGAVVSVVRAVPFVRNGLSQLLRGRLTVDVLDATAVTVSLLQGNYSSAASVMFLLGLSDRMQEHVNARTRIALQESLLNRAETVWMVNSSGEDEEVRLAEVREGMHLRVRTGQTLPVDGTVLSGEATVNEASLTGEATPVFKVEGKTVFAGTVCEEGSLVVRVDALPGASRIDQIVHLVEESSELKAGVQASAEQLADALVPASFAGFFGTLALTRNLDKAVSVLMVDYSCAIKLSMPVAVMSAMREASANGAVVKGGKYLEALAQADVVVFDKTGTLTSATPEVEQVITFGKTTEAEALTLAACLEEHFPHSLARAIVRSAKEAGLHHERELHSEVEYIVAHGIASSVNRRKVRLGSAHFIFEDEGIPKPRGLDKMLAEKAPRASTVFLAVGGKLQAVLCVSDPLRAEAADVVRSLHDAGVGKVVMLTGDSENSASSVAEELGIDEYRAQVLPEDKSSYIEQLKAAGHTVIMVGDGINDSPALAAADVSVALNDASDIARAVADVSVKGSSLDSLLQLRRLSERLMARIGRDYRIIVGFNTALIVLGVASVIPATTSAFLHNASTVAITAANTRPLLRSQAGSH